jgi:hypothetical protein
MIASFDWWLLVVGIVGGAGLVWLVIADFRRREDDVAADEQASEAEWIAATVRDDGRPVDDATVGEVLRLHRAYLAAPVPDLDPVGQEPESWRDEDGVEDAGDDGVEADAAVEETRAIGPANATERGGAS